MHSEGDDRLPIAAVHNLQHDFEGQPELPLVTADAGLLGQALSVLIANALNYTPEGGRIGFSTQSRPYKGTLCSGTVVSDMGLGISTDELQNLFERFFSREA